MAKLKMNIMAKKINAWPLKTTKENIKLALPEEKLINATSRADIIVIAHINQITFTLTINLDKMSQTRR